MNIPEIAQLLIREYAGASNKLGAFHSLHEGWGVIREEYIELEEEIRKKDYDIKKIRHEAVQLGAMTMRLIYDCCNEE